MTEYSEYGQVKIPAFLLKTYQILQVDIIRFYLSFFL